MIAFLYCWTRFSWASFILCRLLLFFSLSFFLQPFLLLLPLPPPSSSHSHSLPSLNHSGSSAHTHTHIHQSSLSLCLSYRLILLCLCFSIAGFLSKPSCTMCTVSRKTTTLMNPSIFMRLLITDCSSHARTHRYGVWIDLFEVKCSADSWARFVGAFSFFFSPIFLAISSR